MSKNIANILVIDDRQEAADALVRLLKSLGLNAASVYSVISALAYLEHTKVDIILLDIELPNINGYQFAKMLRKKLNQNTPPIVALTGYSYEEVSKEAKTHNVEFAAVLTKPVDMKELKKTLNTLLA